MKTFYVIQAIAFLINMIYTLYAIQKFIDKKFEKKNRLRNLKPDDVITVESGNSFMGVKVITNNVKEKTLLVQLPTTKHWQIMNYDSKNLRHFNTLNPPEAPQSPEVIKYRICEQLAQAIKEENYVRAAKLRDKLNKIK